MRYLIGYSKYLESLAIDLSSVPFPSDIMESLNIWHDNLISSIKGKEVDIFDTLSLPKDKFDNNLDINYLSDNTEFFNSLSSIGLKKSSVQTTDDFETFINKACKFMLLYDFNSNELENPEYILFQSWNDSLKKWGETKMFKVNDDIKLFYDKLSSKTIEIIDGGKKFIYSTSNGNDWELQNLDSQSDIYPRFLNKEDLKSTVEERKVKINI